MKKITKMKRIHSFAFAIAFLALNFVSFNHAFAESSLLGGLNLSGALGLSGNGSIDSESSNSNNSNSNNGGNNGSDHGSSSYLSDSLNGNLNLSTDFSANTNFENDHEESNHNNGHDDDHTSEGVLGGILNSNGNGSSDNNGNLDLQGALNTGVWFSSDGNGSNNNSNGDSNNGNSNNSNSGNNNGNGNQNGNNGNHNGQQGNGNNGNNGSNGNANNGNSNGSIQAITLSGVQVWTDEDSAKITWNTNVSTKSDLRLSANSNMGSSWVIHDESARTSTHSMTMNNLQANTTYYFTVTSEDARGRAATSQVMKFETKAHSEDSNNNSNGPHIYFIDTAGTKANSTRITWVTPERSDSHVWVSEGATVNTNTAATISLTDRVFIHTATVTNLKANTTYSYVVGSKDSEGNLTTSERNTFTTSAK